MSDTEARARALILEVAKQAPASGDIRRADTPAWNSLLHIDLIFLIEETFDIILTEQEMESLDSLSAIVAAVERRRAP